MPIVNPPNRVLSVLLIEDNPIDVLLVEDALQASKAPTFVLTVVERLDAALEVLLQRNFDAVIVDLGLSDSQGLATFTRLHDHCGAIPILVFSRIEDEELALLSVREGAEDYLVKGKTDSRSFTRSILYAVERRNNADRLTASEAGNRETLESMAEGFIKVDTEWRCTYFNAQAARLMNRETGPLVGMTLWEVFPHTVDTFFSREYERAVRDQVVVSFDAHVARDGTWKEVHAHPSSSGLSIYYRDITARKMVENELEQFFSLSLEMLCIISPGGYLTRLNPSFARVLGYSPGELLSKPLTEFVHPGDLQRTLRQIDSLATKEPNVGFENRILCQDGSYKWLAWSSAIKDGWIYGTAHDLTLIKEAEAVLHLTNEELEGRVKRRTSELSFANDQLKIEVTERIEAEIMLQQARVDADHANQAKSQFLSRMSHELRTPLNSILGFGQVLDELELEPLAKECIGYVLKGGHHLLDLINEVLDLSRVEAGKTELSIEPIDVEDLVNEACALIQPVAADRQVRVSATPNTEAKAYVMADSIRLKQVLLNLLGNAVKYNRVSGTVSVKWSTTSEKRLIIEVRDTGIGLETDSLKKIFDPFERIHSGNTTVEGTGLGLSISQRLMEAMGGSIIATSVFGQGSVFSVDIAVAEPVEHSPIKSQRASAQHSGKSYSVLAIEDNPSNIHLLEVILLSRPDIELQSAQQGREGLDLARHIVPDLILLDLNLPDTSGMTILDLLHKTKETRDIPIIVVSADATPSQIERFLNAGARDYLTKPVDVPHLLSVLAKCLPEV